MAQTILIKRSNVVNKIPTSAQLITGELALNTVDGKAFMNTAGTITEIGAKLSSLNITTQGGTALGNGSVTIQNDLAVNGTDDSVADITTTAPTFNIATSAATTVNAFLAGTTINVGSSAAGSTTTINSDEVVFNTSTSIQIPVGTSGERPTSPVAGDIRYNTSTSSFEGFGPGGAWGSLGGVKDVDQDTYLTTESAAGTDEDTFTWYGGSSVANSGTVGTAGNMGTWNNGGLTVNTDATFNGDTTFNDGPVIFKKGISIPAGSGVSTFNDGLTIASGQAFTFDGLAFKYARPFTVKDSSGTILWRAWGLDTDNVVNN